MRYLSGAMLLFLTLSLSACATFYDAGNPDPCPHPTVDASTHAGLVQGLQDYYYALERCNAAQGVANNQ